MTKPREPTDEQRNIAFNYADGFNEASTVTADYVLDAYFAIRDASPVPAPPAGPPREPTPNMLEAGWRGFAAVEDTNDARNMLEAIWRAMYAAAPAAEPVAQQPPPTQDDALMVRLLHPKHEVPTTRERAEMIEAMRDAADRIEADAERIRALEAKLAVAHMDGWEGCKEEMRPMIHALEDELAAALERERSACELLRRVQAWWRTEPMSLDDLQEDIDTFLASPDSAADRIENDAARIRALEADLAQAHRDVGLAIEDYNDSRERERAFQIAIRDLFSAMDWPDGGDLDGFAFQEWAEKHGFLQAEQRPSFCGENCRCAEYHGDPEGGFTCYRKIEWLAAPDSAAELG